MSFSPLTFAVMTKLAADEGITDPARQTFYGVLGGAFGSSPLGIGIALALANQEAESTPPPRPVTRALTITSPQLLPAATDGQPYSYTLQATGGTAPYTWVVSGGTLPTSKNFSLAATGVLSGTAAPSGGDDLSYPLTIQVTDNAKPPATQTQLFLFKVGAAANTLQAAPQVSPKPKR